MLRSLEGIEFEGEAGKCAELDPAGSTANSLHVDAASADGRNVHDSLYTVEDEAFGWELRRAVSRLLEMQSAQFFHRSGRYWQGSQHQHAG